MGNEERRWIIGLGGGLRVSVRRGPIRGNRVDWAVTLTQDVDGAPQALRLWDNAHGFPEVHRFKDGEKQEGVRLPPANSDRKDLARAIEEAKAYAADLIPKGRQR